MAATRILLAEDDRVTRRLISTQLGRDGDFEVVCASDGEEAWRLLEETPDLHMAVVDWMMPGLDGVELCRRLRTGDRRPRPYLLLCTARTRVEDVVAGLDAGADDYITKPVRVAELRARLRVGRRNVELERALHARIAELDSALDHVKRLQGLLPICMHCRRIRNSRDVWQGIEEYVAEHSDVEFSHGLCGTCLQEHYPEVAGKE